MDEVEKKITSKAVYKPKQLKFEIKYGGICPHCRQGIFDYDGMLNLVCPVCHYTAGGCFT